MESRLSFIVIGKNQEKTIVKCIDSIFKSVDRLKLKKYEVIYVDSMSNDNTVELLRSNFGDRIKMFQLQGRVNAAIARNVGAREAAGNTLFFIDGDMEINEGFLEDIYSEEFGLVFYAVSGNVKNAVYNRDWKLAGFKDVDAVREPRLVQTFGGIFIIQSDVFRSAGGFKNHFRRAEDYDFGVRLARKNISLLMMPRYIAVHHTIDYFNPSRLINDFSKGDMLYSGLFLRENIFNKYCLLRMLRDERSTILLLALFLMALLVNPLFLLGYPLLVLLRCLKSNVNSYPGNFIGMIANCVSLIAGFLFFYPSRVPDESITYRRL